MIKKIFSNSAHWLVSIRFVTSLPFWVIFSLCLGLPTQTDAGKKQKQSNGLRPNIVLFLVDDMGWMDSSAYGSQYYETPAMEKLATQSMRFTDAYAVPLCSPSRASILTGQYSSRHGITSATGHRPPAQPGASIYPEKAPPNKPLIYAESKNYLDPNLITLAEVLKSYGYRTGHFGKWHLGLIPKYWPDQHGFETIWHCAPDPGPPSYFSPYGVHTDGDPTGQHKMGNITDGVDGEYITDRLTDEAIKFIESHQDEPFYLNLWQYGVHGPWGHKEEYTAKFAKKKDPRGFQRNPIMASMLQSVDESLARVLAKLDELELTDNTLFIFYSDNGGNTHSNTPDDRVMKLPPTHPRYPQALDWKKWAGPEPPTNNAPLREGKARIYEGGQRVPLMVRWPGKIKPGSLSDAIVGPIDIYPTVLDALKLPAPEEHIIDGISFLPALKQTGKMERDALFTWFPHLIPAVSVRQGDWKLIQRFEPHPLYPEVRELYNLKDDIGETNNLASKMPEKVKAMEALIEQFVKQTGANAPKPNPNYNPKLANAMQVNTPYTGLVPRSCKLSLKNGALIIEAEKRGVPFLGTAQVKYAAAMQLKLRIRSSQGGTGKIHWKSKSQKDFPDKEQAVNFEISPGSDWQEISVNLPIQEQTSIIRLYLPARKSTVEIESIKYISSRTNKTIHQWNFAQSQESHQ